MQKIVSLALVAALGCAHLGIAKELAHMQKQEVVKSGSLGGFKGDSKIFSGEVHIKMLFKSDSYRPFGGALVRFEKGARTAWHTHPAGQTLLVTQGRIYTGTKDGIAQIAKTGDTVLCPPDVEHWHGAGTQEIGEHIAITHEKDGKNVTWLKLLSDAEYQSYVQAAEKQAKE